MPNTKIASIGLLGRVRRLHRRFSRDEGGVTAVEFGLLALPFFAVIAAILETAIVFFAAQVLDSGVQDATRLIRTGQAQQAGFTIADFRSELCDHLYGLFDCDQLKIKVSTIATFSVAGVTEPVDPDDGSWTISEAYSQGTGSSVIMVEVYYKWPIVLSFASFDLADLPDDTRLLSAARVFRNEPFS
jgi:Flp pilus assembly protein TadG